MDNPAFIGIHGLQADFPSGAQRPVGHAVGQADQRILPLGPVVLRIQRHPGIAFPAAVDLQAGQVLKCVQGFSPAADQDTQGVALDKSVHIAFRIGAHINRYVHAHQLGQLAQECLRHACGAFRVQRIRRNHGHFGFFQRPDFILFGGSRLFAFRFLLSSFFLRLFLRFLFRSLLLFSLFSRFLFFLLLRFRFLFALFLFRLPVSLLFNFLFRFPGRLLLQQVPQRVFFGILHGQAHLHRAGTKQPEQSLAAFLHHQHVHIAD